MRGLSVWAIPLVVGCLGATSTEQDDYVYYTTCGDPACQGYTGPFEGVPLCTNEVPGDPCWGDTVLECDPQDGCNALLVCTDEDPKDQPGGCPISQRAAKRDVTYLDDAAVQQAAKEALALKLATWQYLDDAALVSRLGFIIDDHPTGPAVRPDGERVDLYGYTSLALAAAQAQQGEIEALKAQVAALQEQIETCR